MRGRTFTPVAYSVEIVGFTATLSTLFDLSFPLLYLIDRHLRLFSLQFHIVAFENVLRVFLRCWSARSHRLCRKLDLEDTMHAVALVLLLRQLCCAFLYARLDAAKKLTSCRIAALFFLLSAWSIHVRLCDPALELGSIRSIPLQSAVYSRHRFFHCSIGIYGFCNSCGASPYSRNSIL